MFLKAAWKATIPKISGRRKTCYVPSRSWQSSYYWFRFSGSVLEHNRKLMQISPRTILSELQGNICCYKSMGRIHGIMTLVTRRWLFFYVPKGQGRITCRLLSELHPVMAINLFLKVSPTCFLYCFTLPLQNIKSFYINFLMRFEKWPKAKEKIGWKLLI